MKNYERKSVEGLSLFIFLCSVLANTSYVSLAQLRIAILHSRAICNVSRPQGLSVIFRIPTIDARFWAATLPFIVGSLGTLVFDFIILTQARLYADDAGYSPVASEQLQDEPHELEHEHEHGATVGTAAFGAVTRARREAAAARSQSNVSGLSTAEQLTLSELPDEIGNDYGNDNGRAERDDDLHSEASEASARGASSSRKARR